MAKRRKRGPRPKPRILPLSVERRTTWRDPRTGRAVRPPSPGQRFPKGLRPKREQRLVQIDRSGRILRTIELLTSKKVIKTSIADTPGSADWPMQPGAGPIPGQRGRRGQQGLIDFALANTNVFTKLKGAKRITMIVKGRTPSGRMVTVREKGKTFTKQMFTVGVKDIRDMMVRGILDALREHGYRTQYNIHQIPWNELKPDLRAGVRINSKTAVSRLTPLHSVDITVTLEK